MLALPSRYEPHGIVVAEALAAGTPVLASSIVGSAYDLVRDGVNGVIFRTEDLGRPAGQAGGAAGSRAAATHARGGAAGV